ncbi:MAG: YdeI/OmpD-associated family protein [Flavobacteriaceae bacterium]
MNVKEEVPGLNDIPEVYFESADHWRQWLEEYHDNKTGINLILYKVGHEKASMRWEDAVRVALCFGWIDSTVKSLGEGKRRQYFCQRKPKSTWSKLNKTYIKELHSSGLIHKSGLNKIAEAKKDGSWTALDDVENGVVPIDLQQAFDKNSTAYKNYANYSRTYQKSYLYWLNQAKRPETRARRIKEIIQLCEAGVKSRT